MNHEDYDQLTLDTRKDVEKAVFGVVEDTIDHARKIIENPTCPPAVCRNRHEAYGIAAEHLAKINKAIKDVKGTTATLLGTLSDPNSPAIEATSALANSLTEAAGIVVMAAAEMKRTLSNLYDEENKPESISSPLDALADGSFEEADNIDDEQED